VGRRLLAIILAVGPPLMVPFKGQAQLNGRYSFDIGRTFRTSPYCFEKSIYPKRFGAFQDYSFYLFQLSPKKEKYLYFPVDTCAVAHDPKKGTFIIKAKPNFNGNSFPFPDLDNYTHKTKIFPSDFNADLVNDSWSLNTENCNMKVVGRTYTDKITKKSVLDIVSGSITLKGTYTARNLGESEILRGSLGFRTTGLDCDRLLNAYAYDWTGVPLKISGSLTLKNKDVKKLGTSESTLNGLSWGGNYKVGGGGNYVESFSMNLDVKTNGNKVSGIAKVYYHYRNEELDDPNSQFPDPKNPDNEFTYSVKGTSKNGIATLNLTGLGVIKGLKATIYIDENTEEIVQNGKNSITLYGQTITY